MKICIIYSSKNISSCHTYITLGIGEEGLPDVLTSLGVLSRF